MHNVSTRIYSNLLHLNISIYKLLLHVSADTRCHHQGYTQGKYLDKKLQYCPK